MNCPRCGALIDPEQHGDLVFDGRVWCQDCHQYDAGLLEARPFTDLEYWTARICAAFGEAPVFLRRDPDFLPDPAKYWDGSTFLLAEAWHGPRGIMLHPPGHNLKTLCHELAHIFTGQDHSENWARVFALLVAWVKTELREA